MKTIHKYPLMVVDEQTVMMPESARILSIQIQHGIPCLWAAVDTDTPLMAYVLFCYGTGHPVYSEWEHYIGTVQVNNLVFHYFF